jgi:hypothetical protein
MVCVRIAESAGISLALASAAGLMLIPIFWWRGDDAWAAIECLWALGFVIGVLWGISRRPSRMEAAVEADHQLDLHDLLGTILRTDKTLDLVWRESLAAFAEDRCRGLRASSVIVNRIGLRGWAGVGILGLLVTSVGMLTGRPSEATAAQRGPVVRWESFGVERPNENSIGFAKAVNRPPGPGGADDLGHRMAMGLNAESDHETGAGVDSSSKVGASTGSGAGRATTAARAVGNTLGRPVALNAKPSRIGEAAAGAGPADMNANLPGENHSKFANSASGKETTPWAATGGAEDCAAAESAIESGQVPDGDVDLVRDYFRRD